MFKRLKSTLILIIMLGASIWPQHAFSQSEFGGESVAQAEEMIILAPAKINESQKFLNEKRNKISAGDGSSAEQITRQGDSNAASAIKRITGVTIVDDKYAIIRGLGERYSSSRLNSFFLPSLEQNKRQFALNIFPTSTLSGIDVEKSYLSIWPSSFSGGLVNLKTQISDQQNNIRVQVGFGYQDLPGAFLQSKTSTSDFLSHDLKNREIPSSIASALKSGRQLIEASPAVPEGFTTEELKQFSKSLKKNYDLHSDSQGSVLPKVQIQGNGYWNTSYFDLKSLNSLGYSQGAEYEAYTRRNFDISSGNKLVLSDENEIEKYLIEKMFSLQTINVFTFNEKHQIKVDLYGIRKGSEYSLLRDKHGPGVNDFLRKETNIEFNQRNLLGFQLANSYEINRHNRVHVGYAHNQVNTLTPDSRQYTYRQRSENENLEFDPEVSGNSRSWGELQENTHEYKMEYQLGNNLKMPDLVFGFNSLKRERDTSTSRFQFIKNYSSGNTPDLSKKLDQILSDANSWIVINQTQAADAYEAKSSQTGVYYSYGYQFDTKTKIIFGHRYELNNIQVDNKDSFTRQKMSGSKADFKSTLPSFTIIHSPSSPSKWIFAYGETLVIPDFRELSSIRYYDDEEGLEAKGNVNLKPTEVKNLDLRYEFYPHLEEIFSLGVFAKDFKNPIEDTFLPIAGGVVRYPQNITAAHLYGLEGEIRLSARKWMRDLRFVHLSLNGSLIRSQVQIEPGTEGALTNTKRAMQGQSDWILNGEIYYQRDPKGVLLSMSYNVAGPRIYAVGTEGRPDTFEREFHQLDFSGSYKFTQEGKFSFRVRNILDSERELYMGKEKSYSYKSGPEFYISYTETL